MHTGVVRSSTDASNTTVHAARMPRRSGCRSRAATRHRVVARGAQRDAARRVHSLVPGVVEGSRTSSAMQLGKLPTRDEALHGARARGRQAADAALGVRRLAGRGAHGRGAQLHRAARQARRGRVAGARGQADRASSMGEAHAAAREGARGSARWATSRRWTSPPRRRSAGWPSRLPRRPTTWRSRWRPTSRCACCSSPRATAATRAGTSAAW